MEIAAPLGRAIAILGSGLVCDAKTKLWRTPSFTAEEGAWFGCTGDRWLVLAAHYIYCHDIPGFIITIGGIPSSLRDDKVAPSMASVIKGELVALGVLADRIITEDRPLSLFEGLVYLQGTLVKGWPVSLEIIMNQYQVRRARETIKHHPNLIFLKRMMKWGLASILEAEEIMIKHDVQWRGIVKKVYASEHLQRLYALEKHRTREIAKGHYFE